MTEDNIRVCNSPLRGKPGKCCKKKPMENGRCELHGGKSIGGIAHWNYKHGNATKWTKALSKNGGLLQSYEDFVAAPDFLSLRPDIALADARIEQMLEALGEPHDAQKWQDMQKASLELREAAAKQQTAQFTAAAFRLAQLVDSAADPYAQWREIRQAKDDKRKLIAQEEKRISREESSYSVERAMLLVHSLANSIRQAVIRQVKDETVARNILTECTEVLARYMRGTINSNVEGREP